ncbi:MAG: autotransporter outer membrane beta-barrel domain-containing protein [Pseudomonadota bacterium]
MNKRLGYWLACGVGVALQIGGGSAAIAACSKDVDGNFTCSGVSGTANVGAPISSSDGTTRHSAALVLASELLEEEGEVIRETGESAGPSGGSLGIFATGLYANKDLEESNDVPGSNSDTWGGVLGVDYSKNNYRVGMALDYTAEEADFDAAKGSQDTDELGLQLFGTLRPQPNTFVALAFRYASLDIDNTRLTEASIQPLARGETDGKRYGLSGGAGYTWPVRERTALDLSAWLAWQRNEIDGYTETGAVSSGSGDDSVDPNLQFSDDNYSTLDGILELNLSHAFSSAGADWFPSASLSYVHEFESDERQVTATVDNSPLMGPLVFTTGAADKNYVKLGAALTGDFRQGTALYASYQGTFLHDYREEHVIALGVRQAF